MVNRSVITTGHCARYGRRSGWYSRTGYPLFAPTVYQDVAFGPLNLGMSTDEIQATVARSLMAVGLTGYEKRPPHQT